MTTLLKGLRLTGNLTLNRDILPALTWVSPVKKVLGVWPQYSTVNIQFIAQGKNLTEDITYTVISGSLPDGITLTAEGTLFGAVQLENGQPEFTVRASSTGAFVDHDFKMVISKL